MTITESTTSASTEAKARTEAATATTGQDLAMPFPPTFETIEQERMHRKVRLAAAFRMFSKAGLDEGVAGHITARDPEFTDSYWVNPFGMHFSLIKQSDLVRVDHTGQVAGGMVPFLLFGDETEATAPPIPECLQFQPPDLAKQQRVRASTKARIARPKEAS